MPRTRAKICGLTTIADVDAAVREGADAIGLVFADSPRRVTVEHAVALTDDLPAFVSPVAVFKSPSEREVVVAWSTTCFPFVQLDADAQVRVIPGILNDRRVGPIHVRVFRLGLHKPDYLLSETSTHETIVLEGPRSGVGETIDWNAAALFARQRRIILAGGLTPDNVADAIRTVRPYGVDVSSGVESSPGKKDPIKIRDFLQAVRDVDRELQ